MEIYHDDFPRLADCPVDSGLAKRLAEMLAEVGRRDATKPKKIKMIGNWSPRKAIESLKARADGAPAAIVCIDREAERLVFVYSDEPDAVYRLANLRARGYVLGGLVFNADGTISSYPEIDDEKELKLMLLNLFARVIQNASRERTEAERLLEIGNGRNGVESTLDLYSAWSDANPINISDEIKLPGTQNVQEEALDHARNTN